MDAPIFHEGRVNPKPTRPSQRKGMERKYGLLRHEQLRQQQPQKQQQQKQQQQQQRKKIRTGAEPSSANLMCMYRRSVGVGPRQDAAAASSKWQPLLPSRAATTPFSFVVLQTLSGTFAQRSQALQQQSDTSLFGFRESPRAKARRVALEKKWARPGPTFYEKLVADLEKDHKKEMWLRFQFKALLAAWRYRVYRRRAGDEPPMDPVTLEPIRMPIEMVDYAARRIFHFEATALNQLVRQALLFHQYTIPRPQFPKNPYTNTPFTEGQLIGLHRKLVGVGCMGQEFHMLRKFGFCLRTFTLHMRDWLCLEAQRQELFDIASLDGQEMLVDFMLNCLEELGRLPDASLESLVQDAVELFPEHEMLCRLRVLCMREIEREHYGLSLRRAVLLRFHALFQDRSTLWFQVRQKREAMNREDADTDADTEADADA